jgi:hypothetical protein
MWTKRGKLGWAGAAALLALFRGSSALAAPSPIFLVDSEVGESSAVYRVDPPSGQMTLLGTLDIAAGEATGLAAEGPDTLYVTTLLGAVIKVTLAPTFAATMLGNVGGALTGVQMDAGRLYAIDENTDELSSIELAPLSRTVVGTIRIGGPMGMVLDVVGGDISKDSLGNWYLFSNQSHSSASQGKLYRLDIATAAVSEVGPAIWSDGRVTGMVFDHGDSDRLYLSSRDADALLIVDPMSGCTLGSMPVCLTCPTSYDLRAGDLALPEPGTTPPPTAAAPGASPSPTGPTPHCTAQPTPTPTPTGPQSTCLGDCDGDGVVAVDELVRGVNIALNLQPLDSCPAFDRDASGTVSIDELVGAIRNALHGCPANL